MMSLPRPDVSVTEGVEQTVSGGPDYRAVDVVISRDGKAKSYRGIGVTGSDATKEVIRKILDDPKTAEYLP